jgi:hypothetical protein
MPLWVMMTHIIFLQRNSAKRAESPKEKIFLVIAAGRDRIGGKVPMEKFQRRAGSRSTRD